MIRGCFDFHIWLNDRKQSLLIADKVIKSASKLALEKSVIRNKT